MFMPRTLSVVVSGSFNINIPSLDAYVAFAKSESDSQAKLDELEKKVVALTTRLEQSNTGLAATEQENK